MPMIVRLYNGSTDPAAFDSTSQTYGHDDNPLTTSFECHSVVWTYGGARFVLEDGGYIHPTFTGGTLLLDGVYYADFTVTTKEN